MSQEESKLTPKQKAAQALLTTPVVLSSLRRVSRAEPYWTRGGKLGLRAILLGWDPEGLLRALCPQEESVLILRLATSGAANDGQL